MPPKEKYTDPKLRDEVKEEVQQGDKGGAPGQWSARKAQFMASEYKKRGGGYNTDKKDQDSSQKNLSKWGEEDWQTKEGSGNAKQEDGTEKRYLPKKAWEKMSEEEKQATEDKKQEGSKEGKQFVGNTNEAKEAREEANDEESETYEKKKDEEKANKGGKGKGKAAGKSVESSKNKEDNKQDNDKISESAQTGHKRTRSQTKNDSASTSSPNKSQKTAPDSTSKSSPNKKDTKHDGKKEAKQDDKKDATIGSKHDSASPPAKQGSNDRLPKQGQTVHWKSLPGWVEGEVVEIVTTTKKVDGKEVKGKENDPRIVLKSKNGKIAVHKAGACYFD